MKTVTLVFCQFQPLRSIDHMLGVFDELFRLERH